MLRPRTFSALQFSVGVDFAPVHAFLYERAEKCANETYSNVGEKKLKTVVEVEEWMINLSFAPQAYKHYR